MPSPNQNPAIAADSISEAGAAAPASALQIAQGRENRETAALGPAAQPISAAENPAPALAADSSAAARGRRTLSTAFVRVGADGLLTVQLHDGRVLVLRNPVMRRTKYCGMQLLGDKSGTEYCGGYAEVAAARPGGAPASTPPDLAAPQPK